jgi:hypothetical protein
VRGVCEQCVVVRFESLQCVSHAEAPVPVAEAGPNPSPHHCCVRPCRRVHGYASSNGGGADRVECLRPSWYQGRDQLCFLAPESVAS